MIQLKKAHRKHRIRAKRESEETRGSDETHKQPTKQEVTTQGQDKVVRYSLTEAKVRSSQRLKNDKHSWARSDGPDDEDRAGQMTSQEDKATTRTIA